MRYLFIKMRRDLIKMWTQFFSVFMMALLGVLIFVSMEGMYNGLDYQLNDIFENQNLADAWVYGYGLNDEDIDSIKQLDDVNDASAVMSNTVKFGDSDIKLMATDYNDISKPIINSGDDFNTSDEGIWLDESYADALKIKTGDFISITVKNKHYYLEVLGLILHPEYIYYTGSVTSYTPDHESHGYGLVNEKCAKKIFGAVNYNEVKIDANKDFNSDNLKSDLIDKLGSKYYGYADRGTLSGVSAPIDKVKQVKKMSFMFSGVFILLAMLTMQTTMTRLISNQRIQIGTLTANGFSKGSVIVHYSLYAVVISMLGGVIGAFIGPKVISPILMNVLKATYVLPSYNPRITYMTFIVILLVTAACTLTTIMACRKDLNLMPAETLRGEAPKGKGKILLEKFKFMWSKLSFDSKWSFRDISRNKLRSLMGIIGVFGCMMLIIAGLGMQNTLNYANSYVYNDQFKYGSKVVLSSYATDDNKNELADISSDKQTQWLMEKTGEISYNDAEKNGNIMILDEGDFINLETTEGVQVKLSNVGVCITRKLAEELEINKGDTITFKINGSDEVSAEVDEILKCPSPQGIFMSKKAYENLGQDFIRTSLLLDDNEISQDIESLSYVQEYTTIDSQYESTNEITKSVAMIFVIMIVAAILLAVVILYNLGILSYTEKSREFATLKVLGFYQKEITLISLRENIITTLIGWIIGIPIGLWFLKTYVSIVSTDSFDWVAKLSVPRFMVASLITVGCSIGVSLLLTLKVKKINMVEALKSVE